MLGEWASYKDALDGLPAVSVNVEGDPRLNNTSTAVVEVCDYRWDKGTRTTAGLIWRTNSLQDRGVGNVLCLRGPTDTDIRPVVFQDYQAPIDKWRDDGTTRIVPTDSLKGGLFP